jgi:transposase
MIGPGTGVRVYLACGVTDMRKGIAGLAALTQDVLRQKPASGAVFAFRGRRGSDQAAVLGWPGVLPLLQSSRAGALSLAERPRRCGADDISAACAALGGD